jgi:hypothetical protein
MAELFETITPTRFIAPTLWLPRMTDIADHPELLDRLGVMYAVDGPNGDVPGTRRVSVGGLNDLLWRPGQTVSATLDGGALRGVGVDLLSAPTVPMDLEARVLDAAGNLLWTGVRPIRPSDDPGDAIVALTGEDPPAGAGRPAAVELELRGTQPLQVAGSGADIQVVTVSPVNDGLRLVSTGEATIYERPDALDRIRWAGTSTVEPDPDRSIELLESASAAEVVLDKPGPVVAGSSANVTVLEDSGDTIRVDVDADGDGYLVVADALDGSFRAAVDGEPAELRLADHAYVAVAVPGGRHVVTLTYARPGGASGPIGSGVAALVVLGLAVTPPLVDRRRASGLRFGTR